MKKLFTPTLLLIIITVLAGCSALTPDPEIREVEKIVDREVTVEVEVEVTRIVVVDESGVPVDAEDVVLPTPTPPAISESTATPDLPPTPTPRATPSETGKIGDFTEEDLEKLHQAWELVEENYYGPLPTDENLTDAIILAMVEELGDPFTNYFNPEQTERIADGFAGDFQGIGAFVNTNDAGEFYIVRPIPDTPAARAGLKPNDVVTHVDGESIKGFSTDEVVAIVRGPAGEPVVLTIDREGVADPLDVTIIRDRIIVPMVTSRTFEDGKIGYLQLISFNQVATDQLTEGLQEHLDNGVEAIIFDLRDNGGGLLTQAVSVGDLFLDRGQFLIVRDSDGNVDDFETTNGEMGEEIPLVLLINNNSASASEIVAAALKERGRATVIGVNTFGKGSVQTPYNLSDGSEFRVTTARFFSPDDNVIHGVGVSPQIVFDHTPEFIGEGDDQTLQRAIDFINTGQ